MRKHVLFGLTIAIVAASAISAAAQNVNVGVSVSDGQVRSFYLAIGNYFNMPERAVTVISKKDIPDDELPVVLFIAHRSGVRPAQVIELRRAGKSWFEISLHFGVGPEAYYVPLSVQPGPPYGRAYGYYKRRPRSEWKAIRLDDDDIVNLVNLRFISDHYHMPPEKVVTMRAGQRNFVLINDQAYKEKHHNDKAKKANAHKATSGKSNKGKSGNQHEGHNQKRAEDD
jgi:hypothetical protein